jgi:hypothetical protein
MVKSGFVESPIASTIASTFQNNVYKSLILKWKNYPVFLIILWSLVRVQLGPPSQEIGLFAVLFFYLSLTHWVDCPLLRLKLKC